MSRDEHDRSPDDTARVDDANAESRDDHPVGTTTGTGAGATVGAVAGTVAGGPIGAVVGGVIGGVAGGLTGHGVAAIANPNADVVTDDSPGDTVAEPQDARRGT